MLLRALPMIIPPKTNDGQCGYTYLRQQVGGKPTSKGDAGLGLERDGCLPRRGGPDGRAARSPEVACPVSLAAALITCVDASQEGGRQAAIPTHAFFAA